MGLLKSIVLFGIVCLTSSLFGQNKIIVVQALVNEQISEHTFAIEIYQAQHTFDQGELITIQFSEDQKRNKQTLTKYRDRIWLMTIRKYDQVNEVISLYTHKMIESDNIELTDHPLPEPLSSHEFESVSPNFGRSSPSEWEHDVVELTNQERWNNGQLPPYKMAAELCTSSGTHSNNMGLRDFFAHCDLDTNEEFWERMTDAGYNWIACAENIAGGQTSPASAVSSWMASTTGHRENILNTTYMEIGVGYAHYTDPGADRYDNGQCNPGSSGGPWNHYWTQNFGRRCSTPPIVIDVSWRKRKIKW